MPTDINKFSKQHWCVIAPPSFKLKSNREPTVSAWQMARGVKVVTIAGGTLLNAWSESPQPELTYSVAESPEFRMDAGDYFVAPIPSKHTLAIAPPIEHDFDTVTTAPELAQVLSEINDLAFQAESDELGQLRPSFRALTASMKVMLDLARNGELVSPSDVCTDRNGDIRISWTGRDRETEIIFPSDDQHPPYMYYSSPDSYGTETEINSTAISKRVFWALHNL